MNDIVDEEQSKQNRELNSIKDRIKIEEEEINKLTRKNQEILYKLQNAEKDAKSRIISKRNENTKLKEDLHSTETQFNRLFLQLSNNKKEIDKKKETTIKLETELESLKENTNIIERKYEEEIDDLEKEHQREIEELKNNIDYYKEEEKRLFDELKEEESKIERLRRDQQEIIANIENNLNSTINKHMGVGSERNREGENIIDSRYKY